MEYKLKLDIVNGLNSLYNIQIDISEISLQYTKAEFAGDFTFVVFPFVKSAKKSPEIIGNELGNYIREHNSDVLNFNVVKGFLNIEMTVGTWVDFINTKVKTESYLPTDLFSNSNPIVVEFSSPNTNKPLHLGHIRNNLLGDSLSRIYEAVGHKVVRVNLVNDRGIHICKSMLAWLKWGNGETPETSGIKGDHLVGKYYVLFDQEYKLQIGKLVSEGSSPEDAEKNAPIILEAQEMLRKWENNDKEVRELWQTMNSWVYEGFETTYKTMNIGFDKTYYESETYLLGKEIIEKGLSDGVFHKRPDGSVWIDLQDENLDEKLLLRSDGTSVYMTQDIGTALQRHDEYNPEKLIYVVGNEQEYHFQVLKVILKKLGYQWWQKIEHFSYGMVELPAGKMKSREGTVVDADDLMDEMFATAEQTAAELGKADFESEEVAQEHYKMIGLAALKYFILKVDPRKNMLFNPAESIDFNGNTGTFIQYTHARIRSVLRKSEIDVSSLKVKDIESFAEIEKRLLIKVYDFPTTVKLSALQQSPALICNYAYDLASTYNQFYHECNILREQNESVMEFRLVISHCVAQTIKQAMNLLGIDVPEQM
ncbi:MAG: arginine--tRNA ligase [Lentimicrobiaceae bacterium]|nr:arginine--tRNA ligase [Lentimicrobiaceae bacterium]